MTSTNRIIISGSTLILCPELAKHLGKSAAVVLQQVHYWLSQQNKNFGIIEDGIQWIRNSYRQWQEQLPHLSLTTIRRTFTFLEEKQIIQSKTVEGNKYYPGGDQVKYFTINYDALENSVGSLSAIRIHRPGCHVLLENPTNNVREGELTHNTSSSSAPLSKMNTPPVQNEHPPIYITKTTSEKISPIGESNGALIFTTGSDPQNRQAERENKIIAEEKTTPAEIPGTMLQIWRDLIENGENFVALTPQRSRYLTIAFKQFFESDLSKWEYFCLKIASSKFLMGEVTSFKANLDWALQFSKLQRILEGGYTFGDRFVSRGKPTYDLARNEFYDRGVNIQSIDAGQGGEATQKISMENNEESEHVIKLRSTIRACMTEGEYQSWFAPAKISMEDKKQNMGGTILYVSSAFIKDRISTHYSSILEKHFDDIRVGSPPIMVSTDTNNNDQEEMFISLSYVEEEANRATSRVVLAESMTALNAEEEAKSQPSIVCYGEGNEMVQPVVVRLNNSDNYNAEQILRQKIRHRVRESLFVNRFKNARIRIQEGRGPALIVEDYGSVVFAAV